MKKIVLFSDLCIGTEFGLGSQGIGIRIRVRAKFLFSQFLPNRFWGPPSGDSRPVGKAAGT
jgi:hypothetical protein